MLRSRVALLVVTALLGCALAVPAIAEAGPGTTHGDGISACAAASYHPAQQPPFGGKKPPPLDKQKTLATRPPGRDLTPFEAAQIGRGAPEVKQALREAKHEHPSVFTQGPCRWQVSFFEGRTEVARVAIDDRTGKVIESWTDQQVGSELARGYEGAVAQKVNAPYVWLPLCLLFLLPFIDPRRLRRLLHLDLLVVLALGVSLFFFNRGEITTSVPLTYPVLAYVFIRMLWAGIEPRRGRGELVPVIPIRWLAAGAIALACLRIALNVADSQVIDIGVAGVIGADHISHAEPLYDAFFSPGLDLRGDVYGTANYLAYVPFELVFGWNGTWGSVPAAHAAAIAFDLATALGLLALGRRLRPGTGWGLGIALAYAWLACPFTLYTMNANANDSLIAALLVGTMLVLTSPAGRGAMLALAAGAKFGPAALAPLFAAGAGKRGRPTVVFAIAFVGVLVLLFLPFMPDGGVGEIYDRTIGYQASRDSPFSIWGLAPSLDWLQTVVRIGAAAFALALYFWPRHRSPEQVAALAAAVIVAVQVGATHWFYFYVVWFLPLLLAAAFAAQVSRSSSRVAPAEAT